MCITRYVHREQRTVRTAGAREAPVRPCASPFSTMPHNLSQQEAPGGAAYERNGSHGAIGSREKGCIMSLFKQDRFATEIPNYTSDQHMSVVLAIDTSGSVQPFIHIINQNLNRFRDIICEDKEAEENVDVCVISFDDEVHIVQDWRPIKDMRPSELRCGCLTDLNGAVITGIEKIRERTRYYHENEMMAEKKPYLIVMTDGADTVRGNVDEAAQLVNERIGEGKMKLFFLGVGDYDKATAAQLNRANGKFCFEMKDGDYDFHEFFDFAANSVKAASTSAPGATLHVPTTIGTADSSVAVTSLDGWLNN